MLLIDKLWIKDDLPEELRTLLREAIVIKADNVMEYYFSGTGQEVWGVYEDFPNCAPPFKGCFIEFAAPKSMLIGHKLFDVPPRDQACRFGVLIRGEDIREEEMQPIEDIAAVWANYKISTCKEFDSLKKEEVIRQLRGTTKTDWAKLVSSDPYLQDVLSKALIAQKTFMASTDMRWRITCYFIFEDADAHVGVIPVMLGLGIASDGKVIKPPGDDMTLFYAISSWATPFQQVTMLDHTKELIKELASPLHIALLTLNFLHCKNVSLKEELPPLKLNKRRRRDGKKPLLKYYTLQIELMKQVLKTEGQSETVGLKKALHICRGHFKDYRESGLFGKVKGIFWWDAAVRGSLEKGAIIKDYAIKV